ncbi:MAG: hypothetical protein ACRCYX_02565 [Dermatophilaceae bacterium]
MVDSLDTARASRTAGARHGDASLTSATRPVAGRGAVAPGRDRASHTRARWMPTSRDRTVPFRRVVTALPQPEPQRIVEPKAVRCLVDAEYLLYLSAFVGQEQSVAKAARELGVPFARAYVRVRTLERVGLLRKHRTQRRRGRPITTYLATACEFDIPLGVLFGTREVAAVEKRWHDRFIRALEQQAGTHLARNSGGSLRVRRRGDRLSTEIVDSDGAAVSPDDPAMDPLSWGWAPLRLNDSDARELSRDLAALRDRYDARYCPEGAPFVLGLHLAPIED